MLFFFKQGSLDDLTGPLRFSEDGARTKIEMETLNLRNSSLKKKSQKASQSHLLLCSVANFLSHERSFFSIMLRIFSLELTIR